MDKQCTGRVFIVEDSPSIRSRLVEMLGEMDGVCVVGEADSPAAAVAGITATQPHCVVLDFQLIGGTGVDVMRALHPLYPQIGFVILTNHPNAQYRRLCQTAGADWFLDKSVEFGRLKEVVAECIQARH